MMKKYVEVMKKVVVTILGMTMIVAMRPTVLTTAIAADEVILDCIPDANETAEDTTAIGTKAVIKGTTVVIYEDIYYGAPGIIVSLAENTEIDLITAYEFSNGAVIYRFDYWGSESPELYNAVIDYCFIAAGDIMIAGEEPGTSEEVIPNPEEPIVPEEKPEEDLEEYISIVDYGSMNQTMYVAADAITLYKNHLDDLNAITVSGVKNEKVKVYFFYEFYDGTVKYKVEYSGRNRSLKNALATGYAFIKVDDLSANRVKTSTSFRGWSY